MYLIRSLDRTPLKITLPTLRFSRGRLADFRYAHPHLTAIKRKILAGFYPNFGYAKTSFNPDVMSNSEFGLNKDRGKKII